MSRGMEKWGHGAVGRVVTWPAPDAYVMVEGVLLRMSMDAPGMAPGAEVVVRHDPERNRLRAHAATAGRPDRGGACGDE
ncbi:hypothetical protein OG599_04005 [Streptomyces sp. NBC_01335]|uniref:hypothetical protein n=1 Tax=Streptomyces sp. NBC_01335 TaxID=2903828 RepID=UPI002E15F5FC|nr:hypothetical protein OG599_04005 [Streptomyces sp. NBC_01335]